MFLILISISIWSFMKIFISTFLNILNKHVLQNIDIDKIFGISNTTRGREVKIIILERKLIASV